MAIFNSFFYVYQRGIVYFPSTSVRLQKKNGWDVANSISPGLPRPRATMGYPGLASRDEKTMVYGAILSMD